MYAYTPTTLTLAGVVEEDEARSLVGYCSRLAACGQTHVTLNVDGVVDFHQAGLAALLSLRSGGAGLHVAVRGAHWSQFLVLLSRTDGAAMGGICDDIRELIDQDARESARRRAQDA